MADHGDVVSKIINCVKQYPALYDTTHEDYNRYYKKIQIWNNIAAEVNYSDGKCGIGAVLRNLPIMVFPGRRGEGGGKR